jgi:hypothetical protein
MGITNNTSLICQQKLSQTFDYINPTYPYRTALDTFISPYIENIFAMSRALKEDQII